MPNRFEVIDPRGHRIVCADWAWEHLTAERPWMDTPVWEDEIKRTITNPTMGIYQDADFDERHVYYAFVMRGKKRYVKVVVEMLEARIGEVITAYPVLTPKAGEKLIWPSKV